ncbi:MAG TPA: acyloxyacyl hydrolase [Rhodanobacter sp.]|nr:acyloxyacyl hydrolase [Rhodanobacter sp.]
MRFPSKAELVAVALAFLPPVFPAHATHLQIEGGRSYMDSHATNAMFVEGVFDSRPIGTSRWSWSPDVALGWVNGRDIARYRGGRYATSQDAWLLAAGARFQYGDANDWYRHLFLSFQPALNSAHTQALSSPYEFVSTLGWQGRRFSFQIRHVSNGNLHSPNRGETMALIGVGLDM